MNRKFKALGLALVAVFAMSAVMASAASAKNLNSGVPAGGTTFITGTQVITNQFDLANGTPVKCTHVTYDASFPGNKKEGGLTISPTYSGCTAAGQHATIEMTGCDYLITTPTEVSPFNGDHFDAVIHIVCPGENKIHIKVPTAGCEVTVGAQTPTVPIVDLTNITSATANEDDILLTSTVEGVHYTTTGAGICGASGQGKLTGTVTVKAYEDSAHTLAKTKDLWIA